MYALQEEYETAIEHFTQALEIDPTFLDAYAEMGYAYADMGNIDSARYIQEQLEEVDVYGVSISENGDEYSGFSGSA